MDTQMNPNENVYVADVSLPRQGSVERGSLLLAASCWAIVCTYCRPNPGSVPAA